MTIRNASTVGLALTAAGLAGAARATSSFAPPPPAPCHHGSADDGGCAEPDEPLPPVRSCIDPPIRIHDVRPVYPAEARARGVRGIVILELWIDSGGRVTRANVLRSVPLLDAAAIEAVRQWRYRQTCLGGFAVPVVMTVTVSFDPAS